MIPEQRTLHMLLGFGCRSFSSRVKLRSGHDNPLGLPKTARPNPPEAPVFPRRTGPPLKRNIPFVSKVITVASGKGGVGKSTVAVNLAAALALHKRRLNVGILDLDIFGPSVPKLMGLEHSEEPQLTTAGAIIPLTNHGLPCMSMGFLLPSSVPSTDDVDASGKQTNTDTPVVWRGLMVQKAVQQLLFDVDWRGLNNTSGVGLDILVVDLPPGTGDVPLTLGQLVYVHGAVIVSTPQDVSLSDVRKGLAMFRKLSIPITGMLLNMSHFICSFCSTPHHFFGSPDAFRKTANRLDVNILGELPLVPSVNEGGDRGAPYMITGHDGMKSGPEGEWRNIIIDVADKIIVKLGFDT